jgi:predicted nucleic acid-binding protein
MPEPKLTVYIETSVVSYLTARPSRDLVIAAHQQITRDWWDTALAQYEAFISPIVLDEISQGDQQAAQLRLEQVRNFSVLEIVPEVATLADAYFEALQIPEKARLDAYHLALTAWHGMDFLVSWNCTHIVSGRVRRTIETINAQFGIRTPVICTPEELMEPEDD